MPIKKLLPDSDGLPPFKPKSNSVYLGIVVFNEEQQVLLSPNQQLPTLPLFTRDRLAYHGLTLNSPNFHALIQWSQPNSNDPLTSQQRNFVNQFTHVHDKLMHSIGCCDHQQGSFYRHIMEFQRPSFKLLLILYPSRYLSFKPPPLSRTSLLHWYPFKCLEHLQFLSQHISTTTTKLWRQPHSVHHAQTSRLPKGLYLALFYCQSSPPNNQRGLQIFLEKHHEHRLPCVPIRLDTRISSAEWEWLQTLAGRPDNDDVDHQRHEGGFQTPTTVDDLGPISETYDFLTKEMQQKQQQQQWEIRKQLAPFQQALRQGKDQLQAMVGVPLHLKDIFSEDSLCMMYETDATSHTNDDDDDDDEDSLMHPHKTLKKKTLSIADMFTFGQEQTHYGWNRPVHVRMLVLVKPLCITPDFPIQPTFDFYPYSVFRTLQQQDQMQFASSSSSSSSTLPRRQPQHHISMSDLLNTTTLLDASEMPPRSLTKRRSFCTTTLLATDAAAAAADEETQRRVRSSMALFYQEKDMKGWTGRLLDYDRHRLPETRPRIMSTCSLPISFDPPPPPSPSFSRRVKRWWWRRKKA